MWLVLVPQVPLEFLAADPVPIKVFFLLKKNFKEANPDLGHLKTQWLTVNRTLYTQFLVFVMNSGSESAESDLSISFS